MGSIEQLTEEILSLPRESRALLADKLLESWQFDTDSAIQAVRCEMVLCNQFLAKTL